MSAPDPIARNIVSQLGDLYMDFTHPATPSRAEFVKYRQATNDQADRFVDALLREYGARVLDVEALGRAIADDLYGQNVTTLMMRRPGESHRDQAERIAAWAAGVMNEAILRHLTKETR